MTQKLKYRAGRVSEDLGAPNDFATAYHQTTEGRRDHSAVPWSSSCSPMVGVVRRGAANHSAASYGRRRIAASHVIKRASSLTYSANQGEQCVATLRDLTNASDAPTVPPR